MSATTQIIENAAAAAAARRSKGETEAPPTEVVFDSTQSPIGLNTFTQIQPPPPFIIEDLLPRDVCMLSAPGGSSKSTLMIYQAIHIILKRDFLGRAVLKPGPVLIVSAEDPLPRIKYRAHHVAVKMNLSEQEQETVGEQLLVEDLSGSVCRLAALARDGNLYQTTVVDQLIEAYKDRALSLLVLDPIVLFGPGERFVNDGDSMMAQIGARLVRELGCATLFIAHSGKANAREGKTDMYSSRGGSALPDGMRMVEVVTIVAPKDKHVPAVVNPKDIADGRILRLTIPKITDAAPITEPIYLRRDGFGFEWIEQTAYDPKEALLRDIRKVQAFIKTQLDLGVSHSKSSLDSCLKDLGMSRDEVRQIVHAAVEKGYVLEKELPKKECRGSKKTHLVVGVPA